MKRFITQFCLTISVLGFGLSACGGDTSMGQRIRILIDELESRRISGVNRWQMLELLKLISELVSGEPALLNESS